MHFLNKEFLLGPEFITFFLLVLFWSLGWKILGLWRAARSNHPKWFLALFLFNTLGILEILYLFYFSQKGLAENKEQENKYLQRAWEASRLKRQKAQEKIIQFLKERKEISNADVQKLLGVSDATATNYLDRLEQEGKIIQKGKTGKSVSYHLKESQSNVRPNARPNG